MHAARQTREDLAGQLRIVGPRSVSRTVIEPVLDEYCRLYPEVQPDVHLDDRVGNRVEDRVDVGFRLGKPPDEGLIARRKACTNWTRTAAAHFAAPAMDAS